MIDWLTLRISFKPEHIYSRQIDFSGEFPVYTNVSVVPLNQLGIPLEVYFDADGDKSSERHPWESIPSSFSGMAFKVFDFRESLKEPLFYCEIQGSPAKMMQGHNVFGSDDLGKCAYFMIELLYARYPVLFDYLDVESITVDRVDITYFSRAENNHSASQFLTALANISRGQTKSRHGYRGETVYFGKKNSRLKKLKVYLKPSEVEQYIKKQEQAIKSKSAKVRDLASYKLEQIYTPELLAWCAGMVRWEATLKHRWFQRRGISNLLVDFVEVFKPQDFWQEAFSDVFLALEGEQVSILSDDAIEELLLEKFQKVSDKTGKVSFTAAKNAYRTYRLIKTEGYIEAQRITSSRTTFWTHVQMLQEVGLSNAFLQNMTGGGHMGEVIPMIRYITVNFAEQFPPWANAA